MTEAGSRCVSSTSVAHASNLLKALGPVTTANVLDYFSYSIFWDPQSTNNQLRMQTVFTGTQSANPTEDLKYVHSSVKDLNRSSQYSDALLVMSLLSSTQSPRTSL
jgi:hypothetical protein